MSSEILAEFYDTDVNIQERLYRDIELGDLVWPGVGIWSGYLGVSSSKHRSLLSLYPTHCRLLSTVRTPRIPAGKRSEAPPSDFLQQRQSPTTCIYIYQHLIHQPGNSSEPRRARIKIKIPGLLFSTVPSDISNFE